MKIQTTNERGERVLVEYTETLLPQEEPKPTIEINDYQTFRKCLLESQEQAKYVGGGDSRFIDALGKLNRENPEKYKEFYAMLQKEFRS